MVAAVHIITGGNPTGFSVIAMGKWGGHELSYGSDLDLLYVFDDEANREDAIRTATDLNQVLSEPNRHGEAYTLDPGLRPEGRGGPLARSLESYRRYYEEWAEPWEMLALAKARAAAGDGSLGLEFIRMTGGFVWQRELAGDFLRSIREMKARVENERIPAGEDPDFHLKLGRGSISDVEFLTQLLQLQNGGAIPALRVPGTLDALGAVADADLLPSDDMQALKDSYLFCTRVRLRLNLQVGRPADSLPTDPDALGSLAASLGFERSAELRDEYRRVTRRARQVFERHFYG
jgi:glutamate-ammonia-ligase adenylyltransferase